MFTPGCALLIGGGWSSSMCGLSGVITTADRDVSAALAAMNRAQAHRGPDDQGMSTFAVGSATLVGLGHRRLSIVDLSAAGHQPMTNPATGDVISFNGEIYNAPELRRELEIAGARLRGHSDTEVLLAAYARYGLDALQRLDGMFAFAIYDARARRLLLARDPLGIKPLYYAYARSNDAFVFASELRAIVASGLLDGVRIDRRGVASLLAYGAVFAPVTMLEGVHQLEPGCWLTLDVGASRSFDSLRTRRWWSPRRQPTLRDDDERVGAELSPVLRRAVARHLVSDVPVSVFLSSGIDSVAIATIGSELRRGDLDTFTVSLDEDSPLDEAEIAARVARELGVRHRRVRLGETDALRLIESFLTTVDQPTADGLNTYAISKAVRDHGIKVALSGLGGDELFGGYPSFRSVPWAARAGTLLRWIPRDVRASVVAALSAHMAPSRRRKAIDFARARPDAISYALMRRRLFADEQMAAFGFGDGDSDGPSDFLPREFRDAATAGSSDWATVRKVELLGYMANTLLRDSDVFGMAHGLEIRVPLLDRELVEATLRYAPPMRSVARRSRPAKAWLVAAAGARFPAALTRMPKRGFSLPIARWMRGPYRAAAVDRVEWLAASGTFEASAVRSVWADFERAPAGPAWSRAWLLIVLAQWLQSLHDLDASTRAGAKSCESVARSTPKPSHG